MRLTLALRLAILALAAVPAAEGQTYHAKLATEDGSPLPGTPQIVPALSERLVPNCRIVTMFGDGGVDYLVDYRSRPYDPATADVCEVTIRLKGYRTMEATFRQGGVVVLKRIGDNEGSLVSITALKAPEQAQKAYGKGVVAMTDKKWAAAQKNFERAVEIYPDYAAAWSDLGLVLYEQSNAEKARAAWEHAVAVDPKYMKPYLQLTRLDLEEKRTEDAANLAERALATNPVEFPQIYFYHAVANYNLKRFAVAEKSVRRAIDLDSHREIPRAEVLLASVLAAEGDRQGAVQHLRKYLELAPKATDAAEVTRSIEKLENADGAAK
ncbi:MAG: tetratricopeptide repeat protein [Bryobacteraceae bacterium]|jgi:tetratricopeptide (TPR) repeat protein